MEKGKLLILLGAGASIPFGMPSVTTLNTMMDGWASSWSSVRGRPNLYDLMLQNRKAVDRQPNFEQVLADMHLFINAFDCTTIEVHPHGHVHPVLRWFKNASVFSLLPSGDNYRIQAQDQLCYLYDQLASFFRSLCIKFYKEEAIDTDGRIKNFPLFYLLNAIKVLRKYFELGIYSLNYDTVALKAAPDLFTGFDKKDGIFKPQQLFKRRKWDFIYHLHGSVHFTLRDDMLPGVFYRSGFIAWENDINRNDIKVSDGFAFPRSDNNHFIQSTIIAGGNKLDQIQPQPFSAYYSQLPRHICEADAILILGYGFGDSHINSIFQNHFKQMKPEARARVMIVDYWPSRKPLQKRVDRWSDQLSEAMATRPNWYYQREYQGEGMYSSEIPDTIESSSFETDPFRSISVFGGGLTEFLPRTYQFIQWCFSRGDGNYHIL